MQRIGIDTGIDGNGSDAQLLCCPDDSYGDLATVGDEYFLNPAHTILSSSVYVFEEMHSCPPVPPPRRGYLRSSVRCNRKPP